MLPSLVSLGLGTAGLLFCFVLLQNNIAAGVGCATEPLHAILLLWTGKSWTCLAMQPDS